MDSPRNCGRTILIGDVHGCLDELQDLLRKLSWERDLDRLIFVGDLVDRGPAGPETVRFVRLLCEEKQAICVMGNHDEKYVRFRQWQEKTGGDDSRIKMAFSPQKRQDFARMDSADLDWLASLPYYYIGSGFLVVHAGVCPRRHLTLTDLDIAKYRDRLVRLRMVDGEGKMLSLGAPLPPGAQHWSDGYDGRLGKVVYGHDPTTNGLPRVSAFTFGIDTGCCFGGRLTALVWEGACVSVPARRAYAVYSEGED